MAALDAALVRIFARYRPPRIAFAGFSDGASYALSLGLANGAPDGVVDTVIAFSPGFAAPPAWSGRPRIWVSHGNADAVLPVERCGRRLARELREREYPVPYTQFAGGHVVTPELVQSAVTAWLHPPD